MTNKIRGMILIGGGIVVFAMAALVLLQRDRSLTSLQRAGVIRIGYAVEPPYIFLKPGGEVTGAEAEVARKVVADLGIQRIAWRLTEFERLISELEAARVDAIVAGMFITPERAARVRFSEPTFHVQQGLLVASGNPHQLHSYAQVAAMPEVKIAVISGAIEADLLEQLGASRAQLVSAPDALTGRVAVETGAVDGLALSALTIRWMALQDQLGRTEMARPFVQDDIVNEQYLGYGAVAFRQGDDQLRAAWNQALQQFIGTPQHLDLIAPFGFSDAELPGSVTTEELLSQP